MLKGSYSRSFVCVSALLLALLLPGLFPDTSSATARFQFITCPPTSTTVARDRQYYGPMAHTSGPDAWRADGASGIGRDQYPGWNLYVRWLGAGTPNRTGMNPEPQDTNDTYTEAQDGTPRTGRNIRFENHCGTVASSSQQYLEVTNPIGTPFGGGRSLFELLYYCMTVFMTPAPVSDCPPQADFPNFFASPKDLDNEASEPGADEMLRRSALMGFFSPVGDPTDGDDVGIASVTYNYAADWVNSNISSIGYYELFGGLEDGSGHIVSANRYTTKNRDFSADSNQTDTAGAFTTTTVTRDPNKNLGEVAYVALQCSYVNSATGAHTGGSAAYCLRDNNTNPPYIRVQDHVVTVEDNEAPGISFKIPATGGTEYRGVFQGDLQYRETAPWESASDLGLERTRVVAFDDGGGIRKRSFLINGQPWGNVCKDGSQYSACDTVNDIAPGTPLPINTGAADSDVLPCRLNRAEAPSGPYAGTSTANGAWINEGGFWKARSSTPAHYRDANNQYPVLGYRAGPCASQDIFDHTIDTSKLFNEGVNIVQMRVEDLQQVGLAGSANQSTLEGYAYVDLTDPIINDDSIESADQSAIAPFYLTRSNPAVSASVRDDASKDPTWYSGVGQARYQWRIAGNGSWYQAGSPLTPTTSQRYSSGWTPTPQRTSSIASTSPGQVVDLGVRVIDVAGNASESHVTRQLDTDIPQPELGDLEARSGGNVWTSPGGVEWARGAVELAGTATDPTSPISEASLSMSGGPSSSADGYPKLLRTSIAPSAHWNFDARDLSRNIVYDTTGDGSDASVVGSVSATSEKAPPLGAGSALSFNGGYLSVADSPAVSAPGNYLLAEAWVKPSSSSASGNVLYKSNEYRIYFSGGVLHGSVYVNGSWRDITYPSSIGTDWAHVSLSYDGGYGRLYVNGSSYEFVYAPGTLGNSTSPLLIGSSFSGLIDEPAVYLPTTYAGVNDARSASAARAEVPSGATFDINTASYSDGVHSLQVSAEDSAEHTSSASRSVSFDNTKPSASVSCSAPAYQSGGDRWWKDSATCSASVSDPGSGSGTGSGIDSSETRYQIDGGSWTSSPFGSVSASGTTSLAARATDNVGNVGNPGTASVRIDTRAPSTSLSCSGTRGFNSWYVSTLSCTVGGSDPAETDGSAGSGFNASSGQLQIGSGSWQSASSPVAVTQEGTNTVSYRGSDNVGHQSAPDSDVFKIDTVPPTTSISCPAANGENDWHVSDFSCTYAAQDATSQVSTRQRRLNADSWVMFSQNQSVAVTQEGTNLLSARAEDYAGNTNTPTSVSVKLDKTPPLATYNCSPANPNGNSGWYVSSPTCAPTASDSTSGVGIRQYRVGASIWANFSEGQDRLIDQQGTTDVEVRAKDNAGWWSPVASKQIKLDTVAPTSPINCDAADGENGWHVSNFSCTLQAQDATSGIGSLLKSANASTWATASPGESISYTSDGYFELHSRAQDVAGNNGSVTSRDLKLDKTRPTADVSCSPANPNGSSGWYVSAPTCSQASSDNLSGVSARQFRLNDDAWGDIGAGFEKLINAEGTTNVEARSKDNAGWWSSVAARQIKLDTVAPSAPINCDPADGENGWHVSDFSCTLSAQDATSGVDSVMKSADGSSWASLGQGGSVSYTTEGNFELHSRSRDVAGNTSSVTSRDLKLDKTRPSSSVNCSPANPNGNSGWYVSAPTCSQSSSDNLSGVATRQFRLNGDAWGDIGAGFEKQINAEGTTNVEARSKDNAGWWSSAATRQIKLDTVAPTSPINCDPADGENGWHVSNFSCTLSAQDATSGVASRLKSTDGSSWSSFGQGESISYTTDGYFQLHSRAQDVAGNNGATVDRALKLDKTTPSSSLHCTPASPDGNAGWYISAPTCSQSSSDNLSGVATRQFRLNGASWGDVAEGYAKAISDEGTTNVEARAKDNAGWWSSVAARQIKRDSAAPLISAPTVEAPQSGLAPYDDDYVRATVEVNASSHDSRAATDDISGLAHIALQRRPAGGSFANVSARDIASGNPLTDTYTVRDESWNTRTACDGDTFELRGRGEDVAGNERDGASITKTVDNTAPRDLSSEPEDGVSYETFDVYLGGDDAQDPDGPGGCPTFSGSGMHAVQWQMIDRDNGDAPVGAIHEVTGTGSVLAETLTSNSDGIRTRTIDKAGNVSEWKLIKPVFGNEPTLSLSGSRDNEDWELGYNTNQTITFTAQDPPPQQTGVARIDWELTAGADSDHPGALVDSGSRSCGGECGKSPASWSGQLFTATDEGVFDLRAIATDTVDMQSATARAAVRIDKTPPDPVTVEQPKSGDRIEAGDEIKASAADPDLADGSPGSGPGLGHFEVCAVGGGWDCTDYDGSGHRWETVDQDVAVSPEVSGTLCRAEMAPSSGSYSCSLDTSYLKTGRFWLRFVAHDVAGNQRISDPVRIRVQAPGACLI